MMMNTLTEDYIDSIDHHLIELRHRFPEKKFGEYLAGLTRSQLEYEYMQLIIFCDNLVKSRL